MSLTTSLIRRDNSLVTLVIPASSYSGEESTSYQVKRMLHIANQAAATKGIEYITKLSDGVNCKEDLISLETILGVIDALRPYAKIYSQPYYSFTVTASAINGTCTIYINGSQIGVAVISTTTSTTSTATEIAYYININNFGVTAEANTNTVTIYGIEGSAQNDHVVLVTAAGGNTVNLPAPAVLDGGDDYLNRFSERCLTFAKIQSGLDAALNFAQESGSYNPTSLTPPGGVAVGDYDYNDYSTIDYNI